MLNGWCGSYPMRWQSRFLCLAAAITLGCGEDGSLMGTSAGGSGGSPGAGSTGTGGANDVGGVSGLGGAGGVGGPALLVDPPTLSNLQIEPNPNNTLSAYVSWTTDVAADSEVQFGVDDLEFRIRDEAEVTEHRVLVIGMHAESTYKIRAVSTNPGGFASADDAFTTGELPDTLPIPELTVNTADSQQGWTLVSIQPAFESGAERPPGLAVMYDQEGLPVWYFINGDSPDVLGDVSIRVLPNGNIFVGPTTLDAPKEVDLAGDLVWQGPPQPEEANGPIMSHDARKLSNGNYVLLRNEINELDQTGALIEEVTPDNEVVWSWSLFDHLQPDTLESTDWCHPNSVTIDEENDFVYLACRWLGVIKARRFGDQDIVWTLGEGLDGGSFTFDPPEAGFADEHDPEFHDDGSVLLYDNGGYSVFEPGDHHSRVLEFALNEDSRVATLVWSFPGEFAVDSWYHEEWYTPFWGDADRLANGNVLITAGMRDRALSGRIFEVRRNDGQVVWEIVFAPNVGSYQSERISPPPLVERM